MRGQRVVASRWMVCGLLLATALIWEPSAYARDRIGPDPDVQAAIAKVPAAQTPAELDATLENLKKLAGDYDNLVPQLIFFSMQGKETRQGMTAGVVIDRLKITKDELLHAITPYLDTTDTLLQQQLRNILGAIDESTGAQPDFSRYAGLLRERKRNPPLLLVKYMLEREPELGLQTLADALIDDAGTRTALMNTAKSKGEAEMNQLAQDKNWWVRYFVVARMRQEPSLRTPALMKRLAEDSNASVRMAAGELAQ